MNPVMNTLLSTPPSRIVNNIADTETNTAEDYAMVEIKEDDLQLVISEKTLGSLTTNAKQIRDIVKAGLQRYDIANYNEGNINLAKKDKALLNKAAKALNEKRIEIEREFMTPFNEFKGVINETVKLINECSSQIDKVVKQSEKNAKDKKKESARLYFESTGFTLVAFEKIFDENWLMGYWKPKDINSTIDAKIMQINDDIATLEAIGEDVELLKSLYLDTLNINSTIQYANTLKQNRERAKAAEEAKRKAEEELKKRTQEAPLLPFSSNIPPAEAPTDEKKSEVEESHPSQQEQAKHTETGMLTRAFKVTTTRENIIALGDFMNEREIDFEKIQL
ncbi:MAG: DUF1351 domain-containing protein [Tannerellaceae bacterium]|jgi:hypothetical protein|nr:DUF1351 domain-containing protein [Tannerellaceae bacterium]